MMHGWHSSLTIGLVAASVVLLWAGAGGLLLLLWPLACVAMMVWMMWGMDAEDGSAPGPADHAHEDDRTHAHR